MDANNICVFAGNFKSKEAAEEFMKIEEIDGVKKPYNFMNNLYLQGDFDGCTIEIAYFDKKTNKSEELYKDFPYGDQIVQGLKDRIYEKLKRRVNTAIVIYDFYLGYHLTGHNISVMKEKRTDDYHIFHVSDIFPYKK